MSKSRSTPPRDEVLAFAQAGSGARVAVVKTMNIYRYEIEREGRRGWSAAVYAVARPGQKSDELLARKLLPSAAAAERWCINDFVAAR